MIILILKLLSLIRTPYTEKKNHKNIQFLQIQTRLSLIHFVALKNKSIKKNLKSQFKLVIPFVVEYSKCNTFSGKTLL